MNFHICKKNISNVSHNESRPKPKNEKKKQSGFAFLSGDGKDDHGSSCTCQERTELKVYNSAAVSTRNIRQKRSHANTLQTQSKEEYQSEDIKRLVLPIEM